MAKLRAAGDVGGALAFLRGIFEDQGNQKLRGSASDYLSDDDDDDSAVSPAEGFAQVVEGFAPRESVDERVGFLLDRLAESDGETGERAELQAMFRPLNAIAFRIGDYERGDAVADSGFYDAGANRFERRYGLNHEIIHESDSREDYDFVYELGQDDQYKLSLDGEALAGKELYYDLKVALISDYLRTLVQALLSSERFARLTKALPFYILVRSAEYRDDSWLCRLAVIDEAALAGNPLESMFRAARPAVKEPTKAQRFAFLSDYATEPGTREHAELTALVAEDRELFAAVVERMDRSLAEGRGTRVAALSRFLWTVVEQYPDQVVAAQTRLLATPLPSLDADDGYAGSGPSWRSKPRANASVLELVQHKILDHLRMLRAVRAATPEGPFEAPVDEAFRRALDVARGHENAAVRVLALEAGLPAGELDGGIPSQPTDEYVDAVVACIDLLAPTPEQGWEAAGFVADRLAGLGEGAAAGIPALVARLELRSRDRLDENDVRQFAPVLYGMGCEEVPEVVHRTHARNQFYIEDYKAWCQRGPSRAWERLQQAYRSEPRQLDGTAAWEQLLHDTDAGYKALATKLRETGLDEAALRAANDAPAGPRLNRQLYELAQLIHRARGPNKDYARVCAYLDAMSSRDEAARDLLLWARAAVSASAVENRDATAAGELAALRAEHPEIGTLLFLDVDREARFGDLERAMQMLASGLPAVIDDDLVYKKAVCELTGIPAPATIPVSGLAIAPRDAYPLYKAASERFRRRCFTAGELDGADKAFRADPFYQGISIELDGPRAEVAARLADDRAEWDFIRACSSLGEDELIARLDPACWPRSLTIARRLLDAPSEAGVGALVALLPELESEEHREQLGFMLWPHDPDGLLRTEAYRGLIPNFVRRYPGPATDLAREVVTRLAGLGLVEEALEVPFGLHPEVALNISKTLLPLFFRTERFERAAELCEQLAGKIKTIKPEWTLAMSNLAVVHIHASQFERAEAVFERVFAQDTDRFMEGDDDDDIRAIIGESVAHQAARAFWVYWAMARFNQACMFAMSGRLDEAMESLRDAVARGSYEADYILAEGDFAPLRDREDFRGLISSMREEAV